MTDTAPPSSSATSAPPTPPTRPPSQTASPPTASWRTTARRSRGRDEILAWRAALASRFTYTTTVTGSQAIDADSYRVEVTIEGDFPGGKADLAFLFTLRDDLIASLVIGG